MHTTVSIPGIHCDSCKALIESISEDFPAIQSAEVDLEKKTVTLEHGEDFDFDAWSAEIEEANEDYQVTKIS